MLKNCGDGYESAFEDESSCSSDKRNFSERRLSLKVYDRPSITDQNEDNKVKFGSYKQYFCSLNAYQRHVSLINQYLLYHPNSTSLLQRDSSNDKRDIDFIKENHQFLWDSDSPQETWGQKLAKKYYDKLFKEYCICDLSRYKEDKFGMRWRIEKEVISGKGQFICGEKKCTEKEKLRTWEMNFGYIEKGMKKNALIKLRLCHDCSYKLNYKQTQKEVFKKKRTKNQGSKDKLKLSRHSDEKKLGPPKEVQNSKISEDDLNEESEENPWKGLPVVNNDEKDREEEFEDYLEDLFL